MEKTENMSIGEKIVNFIKKIFGKNDILLIDSKNKQENTTRKILIEDLSKDYRIIELQKYYESGIIKEGELSEVEKDNLIELYKKQVETLEIDIELKKKELLNYKEKILEAKQKLFLKNNKA